MPRARLACHLHNKARRTLASAHARPKTLLNVPDTSYLYTFHRASIDFAVGLSRVLLLSASSPLVLCCRALARRWPCSVCRRPMTRCQSRPRRGGGHRPPGARSGPWHYTRAIRVASWPSLAALCRLPCEPDRRTASRAPQDGGVVLLASSEPSRWPAPLDGTVYFVCTNCLLCLYFLISQNITIYHIIS